MTPCLARLRSLVCPPGRGTEPTAVAGASAQGVRRDVVRSRALFVGLATLLASGSAHAQPEADDAALRIGYLLQADALAGPEADPDGFVLRNARLRLGGNAGEGVRYFVQAELVRQPAVLDTRLEVDLAEAVTARAGLYKTPFSREFQMFRGDRPLAESPRAVDALGPGRQVGASLRATSGATWAEVGLYNGNGGRTLTNDGDGFLVVARAETVVAIPIGSVRLGASAARGEDDAAPIPTIDSAFEGTRTVLGADAEFATERVYLLAEALSARLDGPAGDRRPWGAALTASAETVPHLRLVGRVDVFDADPTDDEADSERTRLNVALDYRPQRRVRLLADYGFPTSDIGNGAFRLRLQLAQR